MAADRTVFLVTGGNGQVGFELIGALAPLGDVIAPPRSELDLSRPDSIRDAVRRVRPAVIVNAGAYTAVDRAESEREACVAVNVRAPKILAEEAKRSGAVLVHYSTDYVFDGNSSSPYTESDAPSPVNVYGETKLAGERAIEGVGGAWIVLRTSWVFGARGKNFMTTMLGLARERDEIRVVDDQFGAPTWSRSIAAATADIIAQSARRGDIVAGVASASGVYHLSSAGRTSRYEFARAILDGDPQRSSQRAVRLVPVETEEFPTPARRPRSTLLDNTRLFSRFGIRLPDWRSELMRALTE